MDAISIIEKFQSAHDHYFDLLTKHYPSIPTDAPFADFGPPELCSLAIEVHACVIALGATARERLCYLGLDFLYPFDNPVDLFNWRVLVKKEKIEHSTYASIAIRIDSELKRLRRVLELGGEASYANTPTEAFLISKSRYKAIASTSAIDKDAAAPPAPQSSPPATQIGTVNNYYYPADSTAVNQLEKLEKGTSIWSNISTIAGFVRSIFVG